MRNVDDISIDLPAPRDDEPENLRTDIVAELADHLECAIQREVHYADDEQLATQSVLSRFGNPSTIARRLWYDAMQERIMSQRISNGAAVVAAVACLGMFVFMWQSSAANRAMLQQSQQMNSQLLEQMQGLAASLTAGRNEADRPAEWNQLQVRCVADAEDGPPLEGVRVRMDSASENTVGIPPASLTTDAAGMVDFGLVLYGQYTVILTAPNGLRIQEQISVRPGHDTLETFVCPTGDGLAELQIEPALQGDDAPPESLQNRIWYLVTLVREGNSSDWSRPVRDPRNVEVIHCFSGPNGELIVIEEPEPEAAGPGGLFGSVTESVWILPEDSAARLRVEPGLYSFGQGAACIMDDNDPSGRTLNQILIPDQTRVGGSDDPWTVAWGRPNTLTFPVSTTTFAMLNRIVEAAPDLEVATLRVRPDNSFGGFSGGGVRPFSGPPVDEFTIESRVALSLTSLSRPRRTPEGDSPPSDPILTGVEFISFREDRSQYPYDFGGRSTPAPLYELRVLSTPEERAFLQTLSTTRFLYASPVDPETERTSIDPAVQAELTERYELESAESE